MPEHADDFSFKVVLDYPKLIYTFTLPNRHFENPMHLENIVSLNITDTAII
jgi:hypothetical protein